MRLRAQDEGFEVGSGFDGLRMRWSVFLIVSLFTSSW
jgi:hypothetical protein